MISTANVSSTRLLTETPGAERPSLNDEVGWFLHGRSMFLNHEAVGWIFILEKVIGLRSDENLGFNSNHDVNSANVCSSEEV